VTIIYPVQIRVLTDGGVYRVEYQGGKSYAVVDPNGKNFEYEFLYRRANPSITSAMACVKSHISTVEDR